MIDVTDMSTPVTRGELREEFAQFQIRLEQSLEQSLERLGQKLEQKLAHLATKVELELWGGALLARITSGEQRLFECIAQSEQRLLAELARHTRAFQEAVSAQVSVIGEKYTDLPPRVSRLETTVFTHKRR